MKRRGACHSPCAAMSKRKGGASHARGKQGGLRHREAAEIDAVSASIASLDPSAELPSGRFSDLPLSQRTQRGLQRAGFVNMTDIQRAALPHALAGRDVLGAAKTGSGKTLAFLVPVLELLWRKRWSAADGVGAIIISPTRELAFQTFEVLRRVGGEHDLSAGLVIGGKDVDAEKERIPRMNVLICTPGRLLQHMDETVGFDCGSLQVLVLDEADRILDLGFAPALEAIVANLPSERQTMLFSATQTKSVKDLARLSLQNPEYVAVHENARFSTPSRLTQSYVVCELHEKLDVLYSFIRSHTSQKTIVFLSSCKQVRFVFESLRRLRPGVPLMALYGKQKQMKRMAIYADFARKPSAVLFATDIAARGLDFPAVHWVVQADCPEDEDTYIHRVGRTARYESDGNALLLLLPSEEKALVAGLEAKRIPLRKIAVNPAKAVSIQAKLAAFCTQDPEYKYLAQKCFVSYVRSVFLQKRKDIFDVHALPTEEFARSLGLPGMPRIRFVKKAEKRHGPAGSASDSAEDASQSETKSLGRSKVDKIRARKNRDVLSDAWAKLRAASDEEESTGDDDSDVNDDLLVVSRRDHELSLSEDDLPKSSKKPSVVTRPHIAKKLQKKNLAMNTKITFDDDGAAIVGSPSVDVETEETGGINLQEARARMLEEDKKDRQTERDRIKQRHKERRLKEREDRKRQMGESTLVTLGGGDESEDDEGVSDNAMEEDPSSSPPPSKKRKPAFSLQAPATKRSKSATLEEDEQLALRLLST